MARSGERANDFNRGGRSGTIQVVIPLGTSTVTTQTRAVGKAPFKCRVVGVRYYGQAGVTATALTAETFARTSAGAAGSTLESAATDIDFADQAAARTGIQASLTGTDADLNLDEDQMFECVITATSATAGPDDLVVEVAIEPRF